MKHLGNLVSANLSDTEDIDLKRSCFIGSVNKLNANFRHLSYPLSCKLFQTFCTSFYGSQIWDLGCKRLEKLSTSWNKAVRFTLGLPYRAHRWLLGPLINSPSLRRQLFNRTADFLANMSKSENQVVKAIFLKAKDDARTPMGSNISRLRTDTTTETLTELQYADIHTCRELLLCRDGALANGLDSSQNETLLCYVLCD